ncbi:MAG: hypothetical protein N2746_04795 [Deltaproteobacteria bacterium]|nr:hypothetical protein [Deltaproteobacteria bacterium]
MNKKVFLICFLFTSVIRSLHADTTLVKESLRGPCEKANCDIRGGEWTSDGWKVTNADDRIKITLPEEVSSGIAEIYITNFYPPLNGQQGTSSENYCVIFSGFDGPDLHHWTSDQSYFEVQSIWCDYDGEDENECNQSFRERSLKLGVTGSDNNGESAWLPIEFSWDKKEEPHPVYLLRIEWDLSNVCLLVTKLNTNESASVCRDWHFSEKSPYPKLRYFLIAQNDSPCDPIMEATYSDITIIKREVELTDVDILPDVEDSIVSELDYNEFSPDIGVFDESYIEDVVEADKGNIETDIEEVTDIYTPDVVKHTDLDYEIGDIGGSNLGNNTKKNEPNGCSCTTLSID